MAKLPSVTAQELITTLEKIGFYSIRQKGSHVRIKHDDGRVVIIPVHARKISTFVLPLSSNFNEPLVVDENKTDSQ